MIIRTAARTKKRIGIQDWYCPDDEAHIWEKVLKRRWEYGSASSMKILKGIYREKGRIILFHSKFDEATQDRIKKWEPITEEKISEDFWLMVGDKACDEKRYKYSKNKDLAVSQDEKVEWIERSNKEHERFAKSISHSFSIVPVDLV